MRSLLVMTASLLLAACVSDGDDPKAPLTATLGNEPVARQAVATPPRAEAEECVGRDERRCTYRVLGDLGLHLDLWVPAGPNAHPVVLWLHGGSLVTGNRTMLRDSERTRYVEAGYAVASIDYRLAPETKLDAIHDDVAAAYAWLRDRHDRLRIDPERISIVGHDAGGYLALTAGFRLAPRPKAVVSFGGFGDVTGDWLTKPAATGDAITSERAHASVGKAPLAVTSDTEDEERAHFVRYCRQNGLWPKEVSGHDPSSESAWFSSFEPIHNIDAGYPATLLFHGRANDSVPFEQASRLDTELAAKGVTHRLVDKETWGSAFEDALPPTERARVLDDVVAFLDANSRP